MSPLPEKRLLRQVWIFLDDADEETLVEQLGRGQTLTRLEGRFFRGTPEELTANPRGAEGAQLHKGERWVHLLHPTASKQLVFQPVTEGPFTGWSRLDEVRSEVLTIVRPMRTAQGLGPSRVQASTHAWFGGTKLRKSGAFALWAAEATKVVESAYPTVTYDWLRIAAGARRWAEEGGRLHYLYKEVALTAGVQEQHRPHKRA